MPWRELLFGKPLRTEEEQVEQIGPLTGIPVLGLDALASASYGPEAALTILLPIGLIATHYVYAIIGCIIGVLILVSLSYRQTIPAYPQGGGSFTVAKENLGSFAGLIAASSLSIDYVLNVAVAISAGVGALVSAVPVLLPYTLWLCLGLLGLLMLINLRGIRTAGLIFMLPTYSFVGCMALTIIIGAIKTWLAHGHPTPLAHAPPARSTVEIAGLWLLLRSFASGCTALTGIEAVSNAVPIFSEPRTRLARRTLTMIMGTLAFLLAGIAILSHSYKITATIPGHAGYESVLSQLVGAVMGRNVFYFIAMTSILCVLSLSANTSFADFPRVCRVLALDEFLPAEFAHRGSRLVYNTGIWVLTTLSAALLIAFQGITDRLIPLFAVGAFGAFTCSQLGMVKHWLRQRGPHWKKSLALNGIGALSTGTTLIIIIVSKFIEGAWITILMMPLLVFLFYHIRRYHGKLDAAIAAEGPVNFEAEAKPIIIIPLKRLDRVARKALRLAVNLSPEVRVVQILAEDLKSDDLTDQWKQLVEEPATKSGHKPPTLEIVPSAYREFFSPLVSYIRKLSQENRNRPIALMVPELVEKKWYQFLLRRRATMLKALLLVEGGPQIFIITTPWYFKEPAAARSR